MFRDICISFLSCLVPVLHQVFCWMFLEHFISKVIRPLVRVGCREVKDGDSTVRLSVPPPPSAAT